jgi:hypothetical protein
MEEDGDGLPGGLVRVRRLLLGAGVHWSFVKCIGECRLEESYHEKEQNSRYQIRRTGENDGSALLKWLPLE